MSALLLAGILLCSARVAADQCSIQNLGGCGDTEKAKIHEFLSMSREELFSAVKQEQLEAQSIQNKLRSESTQLGPQMNDLRSPLKRQELHKARQEQLRERGQWMANWQKRYNELSKQQQDLRKHRPDYEKSLKASIAITGGDGFASKGGAQMQEKQRAFTKQSQQMQRERAEYSRDFGKKMQEFGKKMATWDQDTQKDMRALKLKEANQREESQNNIRRQRTIVELARAVSRMPEAQKKAIAAKLVAAGSAPSSAGELGAPDSDPLFTGRGYAEL